MKAVRSLAIVMLSLLFAGTLTARNIELLNVSYDPTRELYRDVNTEFAAAWRAKTGQTLRVQVSHGGSDKQARAVIVRKGNPKKIDDWVDRTLTANIESVFRLAGRSTLDASLPGQPRPLLVDIAGDLPRVPERDKSVGLGLRNYRVFSAADQTAPNQASLRSVSDPAHAALAGKSHRSSASSSSRCRSWW